MAETKADKAHRELGDEVRALEERLDSMKRGAEGRSEVMAELAEKRGLWRAGERERGRRTSLVGRG